MGSEDIFKAIGNRNLQEIKRLIENGADVKSKTSRGETPLHRATLVGKVDAMQFLIEKGADVKSKNSDGCTPLHMAAMSGQVDAMKFLIEKGADVESKERFGYTPLHMAVLGGKVDATRFLIEKGADVESKERFGCTPLHMAVLGGKVDAMRFLIEKGADVESKTNISGTPLHDAANSRKVDAVKLLIEKGADVNAKNSRGETPLDIAKDKKRSEIVEFLTEAQNAPVPETLEAALQQGDVPKIREFIKDGASTKTLEFKDEYLIHLMGMDMIMFEEKYVDAYLVEDPLNFVILDENNPIFTNVKNLQNNMEDAIVLECKTVGYYSPANVIHDRELFNPRKIGTTSGYFDAPSLRDAMGSVVRENKRLFKLSGPIKTIPAIVSQLAFEGRTGLVGANHCQAGADGDIRLVELVDVNNIPVVDNTGDFTIDNEASMLANSLLIVDNSDVNSNQANGIRETIKDASEGLFDDVGMERYKTNIENGTMRIMSSENIKYLTNICRVFNTKIKAVEIHTVGINDLSFLHEIRGLERFSSTVKLNSRSVLSHLKRHVQTLETLSTPVETTISDLSDYTKMSKVRLYNFENHDKVIDSVSGLKNVKHLDLESSQFSGSLDKLKNLESLERLTLTFSRFDNGITFIQKLTNLECLDLHLSIFEGSVASIKELKQLKKLRLVTKTGEKTWESLSIDGFIDENYTTEENRARTSRLV